MTDFLGKMVKETGEQPKRKLLHTDVVGGAEVPDLDAALMTILFCVMNGVPSGTHKVRNIGDRCTILIPQMEALAVSKDGQTKDVIVGDYAVTVERVS